MLDDDVEGEAGHDAGGGPAQRSLSPERLRARFDPIFKRYDLDGSRTLDKQEFRLALEDIGVRLKQLSCAASLTPSTKTRTARSRCRN